MNRRCGCQKKPLLKTLIVSIGILSPLIPLQAYFAGNWYSILHSYSLGMLFGIIAYCYFLNVLVLSSRIPFLDRLFGHDRVMQFHGWWAIAALLFTSLHLYFKYMFSPEITTQKIIGIAAFMLFFLVIIVALLLMVSTPLDKIRSFGGLKKLLKSKLDLDYSLLKLLHNISAAAVVLAIIHVLIAYGTQENVARIMVMGLWGGIAIALFIFHKLIRPLWRLRQSMVIATVSSLSKDIVEIRMHHKSGSKLNHKPGQFCFFRFMSKACSIEEHPFTIASAPNSDETIIVVKDLGDYSRKLHNLKEGEKALFDGPYGIFCPNSNLPNHLFIAGGIGITPFFSILSQWDNEGSLKELNCQLIWSVRHDEEMIHRSFFEGLEKKYTRFSFIPVITRSEDTSKKLRIDTQLLQKSISYFGKATPLTYYCGPDALRQSISSSLKKLGINPGSIIYERFSF